MPAFTLSLVAAAMVATIATVAATVLMAVTFRIALVLLIA